MMLLRPPLPLLLLALATSCSTIGSGIKGTGTVLGAAGGAAVAGPVGAAGGAATGAWAGEKAAVYMTGTEATRVETGTPTPTTPTAAVIGATLTSYKKPMDLTLILAVAVAALAWWFDKRLDRLEK